MLKQIPSEARCARASDFERSRAWFKRAMKREARKARAREARARACFEARVVALAISKKQGGSSGSLRIIK